MGGGERFNRFGITNFLQLASDAHSTNETLENAGLDALRFWEVSSQAPLTGRLSLPAVVFDDHDAVFARYGHRQPKRRRALSCA
jgi:hypothetical protein